MLEFKINYYFEKYKEYPTTSYTEFKKMFENENGNFTYLKEVFIMVSKYQIKKYGELIDAGRNTKECISNYTRWYRDKNRKVARFGSKEERNKRNLKRKYGEL